QAQAAQLPGTDLGRAAAEVHEVAPRGVARHPRGLAVQVVAAPALEAPPRRIVEVFRLVACLLEMREQRGGQGKIVEEEVESRLADGQPALEAIHDLVALAEEAEEAEGGGVRGIDAALAQLARRIAPLRIVVHTGNAAREGFRACGGGGEAALPEQAAILQPCGDGGFGRRRWGRARRLGAGGRA